MESTSELTTSFDQLFEFSKKPPTYDNLSDFVTKLRWTSKDIHDSLLAGTVETLHDLQSKIKKVIQLGKDFLLQTGDESDDKTSCLQNEIRVHLLFLKMFTLAACFELPEHLHFLQNICVEPDHKILTHLNEIGCGEDRKCSIARQRENILFNLYSNALPYDDRRVELEKVPYIAASDAHFDEKRYLMASAPFQRFIRWHGKICTIEQWWHMILECHTRLIVMTTNIFEKQVKCLDYFRSQEAVNLALGELNKDWKCQSVTKTKVESKEGQSIFKRIITLTGPDDETREITHFQYYNWPDFGAADPKLFLKFWKLIVEEEGKFPTKTHPPLFHCSAGLGRTGTTLALIFLLNQLEESKDPLTEIPDIDACIHSLRSQRKGMVQSAVQYKFIARVLIEYYRQKIRESEEI